jgi:hypothetical protein
MFSEVLCGLHRWLCRHLSSIPFLQQHQWFDFSSVERCEFEHCRWFASQMSRSKNPGMSGPDSEGPTASTWLSQFSTMQMSHYDIPWYVAIKWSSTILPKDHITDLLNDWWLSAMMMGLSSLHNVWTNAWTAIRLGIKIQMYCIQ